MQHALWSRARRGWFCWMLHASCFLRCRQAHEARHQGRCDRRDSFAATHGRALVETAMACARLVLLVRCSTCCVPFACRQAHCQVLHGRALRQLHGLAGFADDDAHHVSVQALVVGSGTASCVLAWTRMLTCPLLRSIPARYRRAENCGAPQMQFADQVEPSLFGNRDMYAQCNCSVQLPRVVSSGQLRGSFGSLHTGAGPRGSCPQGHALHN